MGKLALLLVATFSMVSAFYGITAQEGRLATDGRVAEHQHATLARNAALLAFERAKQQVVDNYADLTPITGSSEHADYTATLTSSAPNEVAIVATGDVSTERGTVTHKIFATVQRQLTPGDLPESAPAYLDYSLLVEDDLTLNGNIDVAVYATGDAENQLNSNMHTNGNLRVKGMASSVQGFGTYVGWANGSPSRTLTTTFSPNYNPSGAPATQRVAYIDVPSFDMTTFADNVTIDQSTSGDVTLSGNVDLGGTRENPYVWHITGDLTTTGGTTVNGYVIFLVEDDISFSGNTRIGTSGYDAGDESSIAFYAGDDITLTGNSRTDGQLYAGGDVAFRGTATIYGTVTARGSADISGTPNLYYRKASPALAVNFEPPPMVEKYVLLAYSEK